MNPGKGREATAPSIIRKIQIIQRGKEMPPDGGIVLPENVQVEPFFSKGNLDTSLDVGILGGVVRSNGLPSGHTDLNGGHPSLKENLFERILVTEVLSAPLGPEIIK